MNAPGHSARSATYIVALFASLFVVDVARGQQTFIWRDAYGKPTKAGTITVEVRVESQNIPLAQKFDVSLNGGETDAEKAEKIAAAENDSALPITALAAGNIVTTQGSAAGAKVTDVRIASDGTGEPNQLGMSGGDASTMVAIIEYPTSSPGTIPPAGQSAAFSFFADSTTVNGSAMSDGVKTAGMLVSALNASTGLTWTPHTDPLTFQSYFQSPYFDPMSSEIDWNAFTEDSIANFGLTIIPEPACLPVLLMCGGLMATRRRGGSIPE